MKLIFLYGPPASGKLTIARELAAQTGYKLFHNHLVVDALLAVFDFGSEPFVELREQIWLDVFHQASVANLPGLIFTFAPESTVRPTFIPVAVSIITSLGGEVLFIEITCRLEQLRSRIAAKSRHTHKTHRPHPLRPPQRPGRLHHHANAASPPHHRLRPLHTLRSGLTDRHPTPSSLSRRPKQKEPQIAAPSCSLFPVGCSLL